MNERLSVIIRIMRFPLIILVLFIHGMPQSAPFTGGEPLGWQLYHYISELISHNIGAVAVPMFFMISGYLFFAGCADRNLKFSDFITKWKKRVRTLLVPYIIWNVLYIVAILAKKVIFTRLGLENDDKDQLLARGFGYLFWTGPLDFPLWYVRSLMVMSLLAPVYYWLIRKALPLFIVFLGVMCLLPWDIECPDASSLIFFGTGACLSLKDVDVLSFCRKFRIPSFILSVILLAVTLFSENYEYRYIFLRISCFIWFIAVFNIFDSVCDKKKMSEILTWLAGASFFVYALHAVYLTDWVRGFLQRVLGTGLFGTSLSYVLITPTVCLICLAFYTFLKKFMPHTLSVLCGTRI
ncbi:MAG: acyltransferase [Bacteroidales bacterium]|nr:acyltransferase [Bacteroidales bacterium]